MTIRPATAADLAGIAEIERQSPQASQWGAASYLNYQCTVAELAGEVAGFLVCRQTAPDEHEILNLAVHAASRGQGIARNLLKDRMEALGGQWFLEVRVSNSAAIRLYESMRFRQAGTRANYYDNPSEPAIVMRFDS